MRLKRHKNRSYRFNNSLYQTFIRKDSTGATSFMSIMLKAMSLQKPARAVLFLLNSKALMSLCSSVTQVKVKRQMEFNLKLLLILLTYKLVCTIYSHFSVPSLLYYFEAIGKLESAEYVPLDFFHCDMVPVSGCMHTGVVHTQGIDMDTSLLKLDPLCFLFCVQTSYSVH